MNAVLTYFLCCRGKVLTRVLSNLMVTSLSNMTSKERRYYEDRYFPLGLNIEVFFRSRSGNPTTSVLFYVGSSDIVNEF